jgi:hypothetical protein
MTGAAVDPVQAAAMAALSAWALAHKRAPVTETTATGVD